MARAVTHFIAKFPTQTMRAGDVFITNDPWKGTGHLHDFTVVTPVFRDDRLVALFASHLPRRRYRRPRHGAGRAPGLRGRPLHPADALCGARARSTRR